MSFDHLGLSDDDIQESLEELLDLGLIETFTDEDEKVRYRVVEPVAESTHASVLCPRCQRRPYMPYDAPLEVRAGSRIPPPALSRADNATYVCSACGTDEAMRDYSGLAPIPPDMWPVRPNPEFGVGRKENT